MAKLVSGLKFILTEKKHVEEDSLITRVSMDNLFSRKLLKYLSLAKLSRSAGRLRQQARHAN